MEVHCKQGNLPPQFFSDQKTHLLTLAMRPDNTYSIKVDNDEYAAGNLGDEGDCVPQEPKEIKDPADTKPADWVEEAEIADPEYVKPADWVEEQEIPDPAAAKPEDWQDEDDGEWEAPTIPNPAYKVWEQKMIENPAYKGPWVQKDMANRILSH